MAACRTEGCTNPKVKGSGQQFCEDHKLTSGIDSQSPLAQQAVKYGIKASLILQLTEDQGGRCAICGGAPSNGMALHVDHDHSCCPGQKSCGKCVRGLLCDLCNRALGLMRDNSEYLRSAANYLDDGKRY